LSEVINMVTNKVTNIVINAGDQKQYMPAVNSLTHSSNFENYNFTNFKNCKKNHEF